MSQQLTKRLTKWIIGGWNAATNTPADTIRAARWVASDKSFLLGVCRSVGVPAIQYLWACLINEQDLAALPPKSKRGRPRKE